MDLEAFEDLPSFWPVDGHSTHGVPVRKQLQMRPARRGWEAKRGAADA